MKIELSSVLIWAFDMTLKEFIKPIHDRAEHHPMAQSMVNWTISAAAYADLLANLLLAYGDVESKARRVGWVEQLDGITRFSAMLEDLAELTSEHNLETTIYHDFIAEYCDRVWRQSKAATLAHIYVHHMGDMFGGQMLKGKLPGKCRRYEFDDRKDLIAKIRENLSHDKAEMQEAIAAFDFVIGIYDRVTRKHNIH